MRKEFLSRVGWVTAEVNNRRGGRWTATLVNEHPCLSRLGDIPGPDASGALANLDSAIRHLFSREGVTAAVIDVDLARQQRHLAVTSESWRTRDGSPERRV
jgi:hypothetical protein